MARYEALRAEVLNGQARPEGLGAIVYHGLLQGLSMLLSSISAAADRDPVQTATIVSHDREFLRLLANMVLQTHSEVTHVY